MLHVQFTGRAVTPTFQVFFIKMKLTQIANIIISLDGVWCYVGVFLPAQCIEAQPSAVWHHTHTHERSTYRTFRNQSV